MDFVEQMQLYFRGEKLTGVTVAFLAIVLLITSAGLWWIVKDSFARGLGSVLCVLGMVALLGGVGLALKTPKQVSALAQLYHENGVGAVATEGERMEKVVRNFKYYRVIFIVAALLAVGLLLLVKSDIAAGISVGLLVFSLLGVTIDYYAEQRAKVYLEAILELP